MIGAPSGLWTATENVVEWCARFVCAWRPSTRLVADVGREVVWARVLLAVPSARLEFERQRSVAICKVLEFLEAFHVVTFFRGLCLKLIRCADWIQVRPQSRR